MHDHLVDVEAEHGPIGGALLPLTICDAPAASSEAEASLVFDRF